MTPDAALQTKLDAVITRVVAQGRAQTEALIAAVVAAGGTSEAALLQMAGDRSLAPHLRADICWLVPRLELDGAQAVLTALVADPAEQVREEAATGLGLLQDDDSVDVLLAALDDPVKDVRLAALHALGMLSSPRATARLTALLGNAGEDDDVRADATEALAHCPDDAIVDTLLGCLDDPSPRVRYSAAYALGEQGSDRAVAKLAELAAHDHAETVWGDVASRAQAALEAIRSRGPDD
jgi:HEAT repeat protein